MPSEDLEDNLWLGCTWSWNSASKDCSDRDTVAKDCESQTNQIGWIHMDFKHDKHKLLYFQMFVHESGGFTDNEKKYLINIYWLCSNITNVNGWKYISVLIMQMIILTHNDNSMLAIADHETILMIFRYLTHPVCNT